VGHFARTALFYRDSAAIGQREIERGDGRGHVEGHIIFFGEHRDAIGTDLVGYVTIGGDSVGANDDAGDLTRVEKMAGHVVGNESCGNVIVLQFPDGESRALQEGAGLIGVDSDFFTGFHSAVP